MASVPVASRPRRARWKSLLFFFIAAVFSFGVADVMAGLLLFMRFRSLPSMEQIAAMGDDVLPLQADSQSLVAGAIHPYVGYVHPPLSTPRTTMGIESVRINFDEANEVSVTDVTFSSGPQPAAGRWGYLEPTSPVRRRSPSKVIVGILGGSVAESFSVEGASRLAAQLRAIDRFANKEIEFVRLAVQGFKQPQQLLTVTYLLSLGAEFDLLINIDGFNELFISIVQNYERGVFPTHPMLWDVRVQVFGSHVDYTALGQLAYVRKRRAAASDLFAQFPWRNWNLAKCVWVYWNSCLSREQASVLRNMAAPSAARKNEAFTGPYEKFSEDKDLYRHCVGVWMQSSRQLHQLCERHGIVYYHFLQPNQYVPNSKPMTMEEHERAITHDSPFERVIQTGYPLLESAGAGLEAEGLRFHSLAGIFQEHGEPLYKDNCCHVNHAGSEVIAEAVARFIGQRP